jgi:hypothetical protein
MVRAEGAHDVLSDDVVDGFGGVGGGDDDDGGGGGAAVSRNIRSYADQCHLSASC